MDLYCTYQIERHLSTQVCGFEKVECKLACNNYRQIFVLCLREARENLGNGSFGGSVINAFTQNRCKAVNCVFSRSNTEANR